LRLVEISDVIVHIPKVLYYWRIHDTSVAAKGVGVKSYAVDNAKRAISDHLSRAGLNGVVENATSSDLSTYRIKYEIKGTPLITIIIPNKDHIDSLQKCLDSILGSTTYPNYEILIIENNSNEASTFEYYKNIKNDKVRVVEYYGGFNYSKINNFGRSYANSEYLLFLNNDIEIITPDWISEMLMYAQREDIGAVGAKLYYPDDTVQHAGVILGLGGVAGHSHKTFARDNPGYMHRLRLVQNMSAVTAACMMMRRDVFDEVGGFDEMLAVAFNDVDLCMRIRESGYLIVFTPFAELYHYESISRGYEDTQNKIARFANEINMFKERWADELRLGDPYYNPNLTIKKEDFSPWE